MCVVASVAVASKLMTVVAIAVPTFDLWAPRYHKVNESDRYP